MGVRDLASLPCMHAYGYDHRAQLVVLREKEVTQPLVFKNDTSKEILQCNHLDQMEQFFFCNVVQPMEWNGMVW